MISVRNAGRFKHRIQIVLVVKGKDKDGFPVDTEQLVLEPWAEIKTTKGFTLIKDQTDFEKAFVNFTIRYPQTEITRDMIIKYNGKVYEIQYINNVNYDNVELELQAKEVTH